jgi:hypothetical protein
MTTLNLQTTADDVAATAIARGITDPFAQADQALGEKIRATLEHHYPGWNWAVSAKHEQGVVWIRNLNLASKAGFVLHISDLKTDADYKHEVMDAGGEYLERYNQPRGRFDPDRYLAFLTAVGAVFE